MIVTRAIIYRICIVSKFRDEDKIAATSAFRTPRVFWVLDKNEHVFILFSPFLIIVCASLSV